MTTSHIQRDAFRVMTELCNAIRLNLSAPMRSSAEVCLADASACFEREEFAVARQRAQRGLAYMRGQVKAVDGCDGTTYAEQALARRSEA